MMRLPRDPGALAHRVTLQAPVQTPDGAGGFASTWTDVATLFARVEPLSTERVFAGGEAIERVTHRVLMRRRDGVAAGMRLLRAGRALVILTVHDPDESGRYLVCTAREETTPP